MAATRIDCDIHPAVGGTRTTLLPYLDDHWKEQVVSRAIDGLDLNSYPPNMPFSGRADWRPAKGKPGSDLAMVQRGAFDQLGASHAICNVRLRRAGGVRSLHGGRPSARRSTTGSRPNGLRRIRGCAPRSWCRCRRRIWRSKKSSAAPATTASSRCWCWRRARLLLGRRHYWPVWQAAEKHKLPIAIHAGSAVSAARRVRSAGRPIATNIIWPKRRRSRPRS